MNRRGRVVSAATAVGVAGALAALAQKQLADPVVRRRLERSARVWRLTARNGLRYAGHRVRGAAADDARRSELDAQFALRTAEDVARELGEMKGALMKAGQLVSFVVEALPEPAQHALASLYADAPPMAPSLAEQVVREELGHDPEHVFLDWSAEPVAAASIGQVHRAVTRDGREVAVKVQYPGVADAITADLANAERLYALLGQFTLKGVDTTAVIDELRDRMVEELDYRKELANQTSLRAEYSGHPWVRIPEVLPAYSASRVITSEWVDGLPWAVMMERTEGDAEQRRLIGEMVWRFAQHSIHRLGLFNGDPHPGNFLFHLPRHGGDLSVTFLDFGLVKRWTPGEWDELSPCLDAIIVHRDPERSVVAMERSGFLSAGHGLDPADVYEYVSAPYRPYLVDEFTFDRDFMRDTLERITALDGPLAPVAAALNLPPSFVILNRVVWGVSALLGKLGVTAPWRAMLLEYRVPGSPPATPLGEAEQRWLRERG